MGETKWGCSMLRNFAIPYMQFFLKNIFKRPKYFYFYFIIYFFKEHKFFFKIYIYIYILYKKFFLFIFIFYQLHCSSFVLFLQSLPYAQLQCGCEISPIAKIFWMLRNFAGLQNFATAANFYAFPKHPLLQKLGSKFAKINT